MIDDFHGDTPGLGFIEGTGGVAVQRGPGFFVNLGFEGGLEGAVAIVRAEEVSVAKEEAPFVVVGVDEPAGDTFGSVATHFAGVWMKDIHSVDLHPQLAVFFRKNRDIWLAEDDEEVAFASVLKVVGHV